MCVKGLIANQRQEDENNTRLKGGSSWPRENGTVCASGAFLLFNSQSLPKLRPISEMRPVLVLLCFPLYLQLFFLAVLGSLNPECAIGPF